MAGNVVEVNEGSWNDEVISSDKPIMVDFWAAWCGPCRVAAPTVEALASEYSVNLKFAKINVDDNQRIAGQYQVMSIPTFIVFVNGEAKKRFMGALPKERFEAELAEWIG
jgi:thioredoxin 1